MKAGPTQSFQVAANSWYSAGNCANCASVNPFPQTVRKSLMNLSWFW